jgi:TonB family protein
MATAVFDKTLQALADVSGIIVDRTLTPEKIIGQAWIISKSRMVVLASCVANYADAPWALLVKFPYPDLVYSVKTISLHPEFNRRAARDHYLSQSNELLPQPMVADNDIATITIEAEIPDLQPDRVQELNRALSMPLGISAQDLSGVMRAGDTGNILQKAISSQRNGVLNFYDERKVPFCRVLIKGGRILKAVFQHLQNEFAICELMWRKPGGNFVLQSSDNLNWSAVPEINMSTEQLAAEASRRTQDLPRMLEALGGPNVRYVHTQQNMDINMINPQIRWVVERVWPVLDGALPLCKLSERLSVDTYTALQAIWEMKHHGLVAMAAFEQYHRSGQLGPALTPGHEINLKFWDNLQAFYLDDLSSTPVSVSGNYFGSTQLLTPGTLLHTMPMQCKYGAILLKEGRLIALHNGKYSANLQNPPPFPLSQASWVGSLADMSAKRLRSTATDLEGEPVEEFTPGRGTATGLKSRSAQSLVAEAIAPATVGSAVVPPTPPTSEPEILQKFSKIQMGVGGGAVGLLLGMIIACSMMAPKPVPVPVPVASTGQTGTDTTGTATGEAAGKVPFSLDSIRATLKAASFREAPIAPFDFTDTTKDTAPKASFGMESERANQKIYFVVWPNNVTTAAVESCITQPPYIPVKSYQFSRTIAEGTSPVHDFSWKAGRYINNDNKETIAFVGAFPSLGGDKSILVVAMPYKGEGALDFKNTVNVVERMFTDTGVTPAATGTAAAGVATDAEVQSYRDKVRDMVKAAYKSPPDSDRANRCVVNFVVDPDGNISKLELKYSSGIDDVDKAVQKAVSARAPYPAPPKTKTGQVPMQVTVEGDELTIDEP